MFEISYLDWVPTSFIRRIQSRILNIGPNDGEKRKKKLTKTSALSLINEGPHVILYICANKQRPVRRQVPFNSLTFVHAASVQLLGLYSSTAWTFLCFAWWVMSANSCIYFSLWTLTRTVFKVHKTSLYSQWPGNYDNHCDTSRSEICFDEALYAHSRHTWWVIGSFILYIELKKCGLGRWCVWRSRYL